LRLRPVDIPARGSCCEEEKREDAKAVSEKQLARCCVQDVPIDPADIVQA
jgi:hypothetical protein